MGILDTPGVPRKTWEQMVNGQNEDAGTLTGGENVPVTGIAGLLQTTLNKIAAFVRGHKAYPLQVGNLTRCFEIDGDFYMAYNADWDGTNWQRIDPAKVAWLHQVHMTNNMTFESYKALSEWVCQPGDNPIGNYGSANGWTLLQSYSQYHDMTIGGFGMEIDGNGTFPYGRLQHATIGGLRRTGLMTNLFVDESARDDNSKPAWWCGFHEDSFRVQRVPGDAALVWQDLLKVSPDGSLSLGALGAGLNVKEGLNGRQGAVALSNGVAVVPNQFITANSRIWLTAQDNNTQGALRVSQRVTGTSFTIQSNNGADSGIVAYGISEPAS